MISEDSAERDSLDESSAFLIEGAHWHNCVLVAKHKSGKRKAMLMAESKEDSGPFVRVESRRRTKGRAVRAEIAEARGSAILACVAELQEKDHGGHLILTRTGMVGSLDAIYGQQLREGGIKDTNKRRAVRGAMREELEELLEAKGWRIVDVRSGPGAGGEAGSGCECGDRIESLEQEVAWGKAVVAKLSLGKD